MVSQLRGGRFLGEPVRMQRISDLVLADVTYSANLRLPRHTHERPYFCLIRRGTYSERYGRRNRACRPSMVVYHPAGEHDCQQMHSRDVASFNVEVGPKWLERMTEVGIASDQPAQFEGGRPQALAAGMLEELDHGDCGFAPAIEDLFWELLAEIRSEASGNTCGANVSVPPATCSRTPSCRSARLRVRPARAGPPRRNP